MIPVKQLVTSMRYSLKDMRGVNYSNFELIEAINNAAWILYSRMAEQFVSAGLKKNILVVDESGSIALPTDFIKIHQVGMADEGRAVPVSYTARNDGEYRIIGDTFYALEGVYSLEYYYVPARVSSLSDFIDITAAVSPYIEKIALGMLGNDLGGAENVVRACVQSLAGRDISHFEDIGPVQIFGGKL